eukprot:1192493-Prorocentrum_minimum.AAC.4
MATTAVVKCTRRILTLPEGSKTKLRQPECLQCHWRKLAPVRQQRYIPIKSSTVKLYNNAYPAQLGFTTHFDLITVDYR